MLREAARQRLQAIAEQGQTRLRRTAHSPTAVHQWASLPGQEPLRQLHFCSNDYLGLASHPSVVQALVDGARRHGVGSGASHLVTGHHAAHETLEQVLAAWFEPWVEQARALSFSTGYMANLAVVTGLAGLVPADEVAIFSDALNHASLIDACRLSRAAVHRYPHADLQALEHALERCPQRLRIIVTDGVFSMDGDLAPLPPLMALAQAHDAWLVVDDAHGLGVLGARGRGTVEALLGSGVGVTATDRLIVVGTLGKAVGAAGAFVVAQADLAEALLQTARPYIFTTASPPALADAVRASLGLIESEEGSRRRAHLQALVARWRSGAQALVQRHPAAGWALLPSQTPIQALVIGDNRRAVALSAELEGLGLRVPAIRPPTVPTGTARLRITFSSDHTPHDLERLLAALSDIAEHAT